MLFGFLGSDLVRIVILECLDRLEVVTHVLEGRGHVIIILTVALHGLDHLVFALHISNITM